MGLCTIAEWRRAWGLCKEWTEWWPGTLSVGFKKQGCFSPGTDVQVLRAIQGFCLHSAVPRTSWGPVTRSCGSELLFPMLVPPEVACPALFTRPNGARRKQLAPGWRGSLFTWLCRHTKTSIRFQHWNTSPWQSSLKAFSSYHKSQEVWGNSMR